MVEPSKRRSRVGRLAPAVSVFVGAATVALMAPSRVLAQTPPPAPPPVLTDPAPLAPPGSALMSDILGWLKWGALWASVAALLIGAIAIGVGHFGSNYGASSAGRKWLLGGIACAALASLAWTFASTVYNSTS